MAEYVVETTDIFRGAYFLCKGAELCGIRMSGGNRSRATFVFRGQGLKTLDRQYRSGRARVNPAELRETLNLLRDSLFAKLRENERRAGHDRQTGPGGPQAGCGPDCPG